MPIRLIIDYQFEIIIAVCSEIVEKFLQAYRGTAHKFRNNMLCNVMKEHI